MYRSDLYGTMQVNQGSDTGNMTFGIGPGQYPGTLMHVTNNTWYLSFPNPDDQVGYLTFAADPRGSVTGFTSTELGPFARV
jgi:hypothetical protein